MNKVSVNKITERIVKEFLSNSQRLRVSINKLNNGTTIIDTGLNAPGGFEAGKLVTAISLGGLADVEITTVTNENLTLPTVFVKTDHPAISIAGCQWAWTDLFPLPFIARDEEYSALLSGPAKCLVRRPVKHFDKISYKDDTDFGIMIVQSDRLPNEQNSEYIAKEVKVDASNLFLVVAPTNSIAGSTQVSARILEDGLLSLVQYLNFDINKVKAAFGSCPIAPTFSRMWKEPGITPDDMIRNCGRVHFVVYSSEKDDLSYIAKNMVTENTPAHGKSFYQLIQEGQLAEPDFNKKCAAGTSFVIAEVTLSDLRTGKIYKAGKVHTHLIEKFAGM